MWILRSGLDRGRTMGGTPYTVVFCGLTDCMYYTPEPDREGMCRCIHPLKLRHMDTRTCPLFQLDWQRKQKAAGPMPMPKRKPLRPRRRR